MTAARPIVVCVDDDPDLLAGVVRTLRAMKIELLATTSPEEALGWVATRDVAVLVSDYDMPVMNGVDLVIAARRLRAATVRILLTGVREFATALEGINQGEVFRYINKPFDTALLRLAVTEALDRHLELVAATTEREQTVRRQRLAVELEQEYPRLTQVERDLDGAYVVPATAPAAVAGLGLDAVIALVRR